MNNTDKENEWKKEWSKFEAEYFTNTGFLPTRDMAYLQACRARQSDYLELKTELDLLKSIRESQSSLISKIHEEKLLLKAELEKARELLRLARIEMDSWRNLSECDADSIFEWYKMHDEFLKREGE
jgi:hypothetical protein